MASVPGTDQPRKAKYRLDDPVEVVRGIGPRWAAELAERGVHVVADLLDHLPFRYEDRRVVQPLSRARAGESLTAIGEVLESAQSRTKARGVEKLTLLLDDGQGALRVVFFARSYLSEYLGVGVRLLVHGVPRRVRGGIELHGPEFDLLKAGESPSRFLGWLPVYERLGPLTPRRLRTVLSEILDGVERIPDPIPERLLADQEFPSRDQALRALHKAPPEVSGEELQSRRSKAHRRIAYEEFFLLELAMAIKRRRRRAESRVGGYEISDALRQRLAAILPFTLTGAQKRVLREIGEDLKSAWPMNRLLLGDVGSGKTVVAVLAMMVARDNGYQAALMAPTEILAQQHVRSLTALLAPAGVGVELLTAGMPAAGQKLARSRLASGEASLVVGTHSLISGKVEFHRLGLAVIDEQHRFGVLQRADLVSKGEHPDVLVMSATPIPRTLAMVIYGDLDVSTIDEKPPGRRPIRTVLRRAAERARVFSGIDKMLSEGQRIFVVRPAVEEGPSGMRAAATGLSEYSARFPGARVAMLHGRMKAPLRNEALQGFARGEIDILVATTVIEVGVDVSDATVIIVEDAERFGLAQLHQLRGRVGRGSDQSYCVLVASENAAPEAMERLEVLVATDDGFRVAERDLEIRGPGEMVGTSQSGYPSFRVADLVRHQDLLLRAREDAFEWIENTGEHSLTRALHDEAWRKHGALLRVVDRG